MKTDFPWKRGRALALVCLVAGVGASGCSRAPSSGPGPAAVPARDVRTAVAGSRSMERVVAASGWLVAREQTALSTKVAGRLKWIGVDVGSVIEAGQGLAQVEPRDYELRVQQAAAAVAQARAALGLPVEGDEDRMDEADATMVRQARAVLEEARLNRERVLRLAADGIAAAAERDAVEAAYRVATERLEAAFLEVRTMRAALVQRRVELELARQQLTDTTLRAPYDGVVQSRIAQLGEYLPAGARVLVVVQADPLRLRLEVSEREAVRVRGGQPVRLVGDDGGRRWEGRLDRVSPALESDTRMLEVEADVPNAAGAFRPGFFVRGEIVVAGDEPGLAVPAGALVVFAGVQKVITVEGGKAVEKAVQTGRRGADWVEIVSGLRAGERVIVDPGGVRTGQPVRVQGDAEAR